MEQDACHSTTSVGGQASLRGGLADLGLFLNHPGSTANIAQSFIISSSEQTYTGPMGLSSKILKGYYLHATNARNKRNTKSQPSLVHRNIRHCPYQNQRFVQTNYRDVENPGTRSRSTTSGSTMAVTAETPAPHNLETNLQNRTFMDTVEISPTGSVEEIIDNIDQFLSKVHTASSVLPDNSNNGNNQPQSRHASGGQIDEFQGFLDMLNEPIWDTTTTTTTIDMDTDGTDEQTEPAVSYITTATTDHGELEDNIDQNALSSLMQDHCYISNQMDDDDYTIMNFYGLSVRTIVSILNTFKIKYRSAKSIVVFKNDKTSLADLFLKSYKYSLPSNMTKTVGGYNGYDFENDFGRVLKMFSLYPNNAELLKHARIPTCVKKRYAVDFSSSTVNLSKIYYWYIISRMYIKSFEDISSTTATSTHSHNELGDGQRPVYMNRAKNWVQNYGDIGEFFDQFIHILASLQKDHYAVDCRIFKIAIIVGIVLFGSLEDIYSGYKGDVNKYQYLRLNHLKNCLEFDKWLGEFFNPENAHVSRWYEFVSYSEAVTGGYKKKYVDLKVTKNGVVVEKDQ